MLNSRDLEDLADRFARLDAKTLLLAGFMSGITSGLLWTVSPMVGMEFTAFNVPLVYSLWVVDDMKYSVREDPGIFVAIVLAGGLFGAVMNSLFA